MIRHSDPGSILASGILACIVLLGPIPFGSVMPRERAALQVAAFVSLALALLSCRDTSSLRILRWPTLALVLVAAIGLVQSLPWPAPVARVLAPGVASQWIEMGTTLDTAGAAGELADGGMAGDLQPSQSSSSWIPLTMAPSVSRTAALHWLAVAAAFLAAGLQGRERGARRLISFALIATVTFQIIYGADRWIGRKGTIWGVDVPGDTTRLRGTFVNSDHFAMLLAMAVTGSVAWLWWAVRKNLRNKREEAEHQVIRLSAPILTFGLFFVGLAFTGSRAGLVALVLALLVQGLLLAIRYRRWQLGFVAVGLVSLGGGGVALFGWRRGFVRWMETSAYEITWSSRFQVWLESLELWWSSPFFGTGLGTFRQAFPEVQPTSLRGTWTHAHNDLLELWVTVGPLPVIVLAMVLVGLCGHLWKLLRQGRRSEDRAAALAAFGILAATSLHSLVDFGLTIPANAFTFVILLGVVSGSPLLRPKARSRQTVFLEDEPQEPDQDSEARTGPGTGARTET